MNGPNIARMMATIPYPFDVTQAQEWIDSRPFSRKVPLGFGAKIALRDGTLIGFSGLGGDPLNTAYALGRACWGQGFLADAIGVHGLREITAGAMFDNPASQRVLEKPGFERIGEKPHKASGRGQQKTLFLYRLTM